MAAPLILTAALDAASQAFFDRARERWFPPELNFIGAHVTLFHHLPAGRRGGIMEQLLSVCGTQAPIAVSVSGVRSLGRGVAYRLLAPDLAALRSRIATRWQDDLTPQDRQAFHPHVTVQNKVPPVQARALLAHLSCDFVPFEATAIGVAIWRYCGGPWESEDMVPFAG